MTAISSACDAALRPAGERELAVAIEPMFAWAKAFGLATDVFAVTRAYRMTLNDLPPDIIARGVAKLISTWSYRNMPLPADLRKACEEDPMLISRRAMAWRVTRALKQWNAMPDSAKQDRGAVSAADRSAELDAIKAGVLAKHRMPGAAA